MAYARVLDHSCCRLVTHSDRIGNNIRDFYSNIQVLKSQYVLSFVGLVFCCSSTLSESWYMIVVVVILLLLNLAIYRCSNRLRVFLEQMKTLYTALPFLGNCGGIIAILFGFVYLAEALDEHQGIDVFAVGFFYCLFINFSTLAKVLGAKDFWGIADNTMALSILLLITFKGVLKKTFARNLVLVGVIEVVFEMFKMAPITVKNVTNAVPVLPVQEAGNVVPIPPTSQQVVCKYWTLGICNKGVGCQFLHSYSTVPGLGLSKILQIRGIAFLPGSEVLYSASCDGLMQTWRQGSYDLLETKRLRDEVGSLVSGDLWIFLGMRNDIKIFNNENECQYILGVDGLVSAMLFGNDMIIAGTSNGRIVFWRILHGVMNVGHPFGKTISFRDTHMDEVTSLVIGGDQNLYSGSLDGSIMVWNFNSLACIQTRVVHSDSVTSLVWGNQRVFSSSLDGTVIGSRLIGIEILWILFCVSFFDICEFLFCGVRVAEECYCGLSVKYGLVAYGLGTKGDLARSVKDKRFDLEIRKGILTQMLLWSRRDDLSSFHHRFLEVIA